MCFRIVLVNLINLTECPIGFYHNADENSCVQCPVWSTTHLAARSSLAECECIDGYHGNYSENVPCSGMFCICIAIIKCFILVFQLIFKKPLQYILESWFPRLLYYS